MLNPLIKLFEIGYDWMKRFSLIVKARLTKRVMSATIGSLQHDGAFDFSVLLYKATSDAKASVIFGISDDLGS